MFKKLQLKNGLRVLLVESHKSPVLSIQMWVKTGSADEKKGEEGISHFIEHLVFKGSRKYDVGQIAASVEAAGGELNAYTSFDQTVFYVTISKEFEDVGLDVIAEMMGHPRFDAKEIDNEREVVIEEIKRSNDSPHRQAGRLLFETVYKKHPYGIPVIGYEDNIKKVPRKTLVNYYRGRYNPKTMTLVVAGDFTAAVMKKKVAQHFGTFPKAPLRSAKRRAEPAVRRSLVAVKTAPFAETIVHLTFPSPKASHRDIAALEVLALILGQGDSSRLNHRLRLQNHLVNFAGCSVFTARDPGFFAVSLSLNDKDLTQSLQGLREELIEVWRQPVTMDELQKAITNMTSEQYYSLETVDGLARKYGHYQDLFGDPSYFERFMKQVQALTPLQLLKVARKYFNPKLSRFVIMTPAAQDKIQSEAQAWLTEMSKTYLREVKTRPKLAKKLRKTKAISWKSKKINAPQTLQKWTLKNGITLITRPSDETPVFSLRAASRGGSRLETGANQGAGELLSRVWTAGVEGLSEVAMNQRIDELAGSLSAFVGRNSQGLSMTGLRPFSPALLELFFKTWTGPQMDAVAVQREIKAMQEHVKLRQDNPGQLCALAFMKNLFGEHPYGRDPYGDVESLARLQRDQALALYRQGRGLTLVASGAFDPAELKTRVEEGLGSWTVVPGTGPTFALRYPQKEIRVFQLSAKEQSHIVVGFPGLKLDDPARYALQVLQAILAGQGGRLFLELRDKASLAYSVSPLRMDGVDGGYFGAYIGCSPEKSETAIRMMRAEFEKLSSTIVGQDEMSRAQRYLIGKHDIELQKNGNITLAVLFDEIYGIDYRETYHFTERIRAVTSTDVMKLAQRLFQQPAVISLVGPKAPWSV